MSKVSKSPTAVGLNSRLLFADTDQFDEALDRRVWSLSDQRLKWDLEIALKRRNTPNDVETLVRDLLKSQQEADANSPSARPIDMDNEMEIDDENEGLSHLFVFARFLSFLLTPYRR